MKSNDDLSIGELQKLLGVTVDGKLGPRTKDAIRAIQRHAGIPEDGKLGPQTDSALQSLGPNEIAEIVNESRKTEPELRALY